MLTIHRYVIHELKKNAQSTDASIVISSDLGIQSELSNSLVNKIHEAYNNDTFLKNTIFQDRNDKVFKNKLTAYVTNESDGNFYSFSEDSLKEMQNDIVNEPFATGGFYLYADYSLNSNRYVAVVLLRRKEGLNLKLKNGIYVIDPTENLNIDKIALGFRLNVNIYGKADDDRNYVALVTNQKDKVSGYFKEWVAAEGVASDDANSKSFVRIIKAIELPLDENGQQLSRDNFKKEVFDFIEGQPKKRVNLKNLSAHFYGEDNPDFIVNFAASENIIIDNEFRRASAPLKSLIKVKAKVNGIELNVDYDMLNSQEVDVLDDMVIIRNTDIIRQIKEQSDT